MLRSTFPLSSARLLLRPFTSKDADDVWEYQRQPEVARHMRWEARDRRQARESVAQMAREDRLAEEGDCLALAVVWPEVGRVVGQVELVWRDRDARQGEVGYVFNPRYQGRGLATEAAREMLRLGFEELDLYRIMGRCSADNAASARLLARLGMRQEAHFIDNAVVKGGWRSELVFAMLRHEWDGRSKAPDAGR